MVRALNGKRRAKVSMSSKKVSHACMYVCMYVCKRAFLSVGEDVSMKSGSCVEWQQKSKIFDEQQKGITCMYVCL